MPAGPIPQLSEGALASFPDLSANLCGCFRWHACIAHLAPYLGSQAFVHCLFAFIVAPRVPTCGHNSGRAGTAIGVVRGILGESAGFGRACIRSLAHIVGFNIL